VLWGVQEPQEPQQPIKSLAEAEEQEVTTPFVVERVVRLELVQEVEKSLVQETGVVEK
jgi:hypothetical protein